MDTSWIEAVMRMNDQIAEAEARVRAQASKLCEMLQRGEDTTKDEGLFLSSWYSIHLLRATQTNLLQAWEDGE